LRLTCGILHWEVPFDNIASAQVDLLPASLCYEGAAIHWMILRGRYRQS